MIVVLNDESR